MKVLYLVNLPAPYRVDFFNELANYVDLTVLYERKKANSRNSKWKSKQRAKYNEIYLKSRNIGDDNAISFQIFKYIKQFKNDLIVIGQYSSFTAILAIIYMKIRRIKFVLNSDGGFINETENIIKRVIKRNLISSAEYWLSSGKNTTKYLSYYGANNNRIYEYPFTSIRKSEILNNILSSKEKEDIRKKIGIPTDKKIVISVGRFLDWKGFDVLINSAKYFDSNTDLIIIGDEPKKEYLDTIKENGLNNIIFPGFLDKEKLLEYYKSSDLFALATKDGIWELVINEAISCGLPIVTTKKCGSSYDLVNKKNGYIVNNYNDYKEFATVINNILKYNTDNMSKESLRIANIYTIENMANKTYKIFQSIRGEISEK